MKPINVTLRQLRAFASLARYGRFRAAASAFNLSQSAFSTAIRQMERELGIALFDRTTRRVELTAAGRMLLPEVERLLAEFDRALRDVQSAGEAQRGRVVVASIFSIATDVLPVIIREFKSSHPNVRVDLLDFTASQVQASVRDATADMGICARSEIEGNLEFELLVVDPFVAIIPEKHPLAKARKVALENVVRYPFVAMAKGTQIRSVVDAALRERGLRVTPAYEATQPSTIVAMVNAGLGLSVLPKRTLGKVRSYMKKLADEGFVRELGIITRAGQAMTPAAEAFRRQLVRYFAITDRRPRVRR